MIKSVILAAGGKGERMGIETPKQFLLLGGLPVLMHSLIMFNKYEAGIEIVVALPAPQIEYWHSLCRKHRFTVKHKTVSGGKTRFHSIQNALAEIKTDGLTAVHDGVRPLVSQDTIDRCFQTAKNKGVAVPVIRIAESLRFVQGKTNKRIDRDKVFIVQTPQVFQTSILKECYRQKYSAAFTDDATIAEKLGYPVHLVEGNRENIKITEQADMEMAKMWLKK